MLTDLFVIVIYFLAIFCIGIYAGRKQNSLTDYALGNRSLPWWAILASILAAEISAATFLGAPGEGYHTRNFTYAQLCIGTILGRIIVGRLFLKPYYDYKVVSIYEYLEKRFGLLTRRTASMVFLISRVLCQRNQALFRGHSAGHCLPVPDRRHGKRRPDCPALHWPPWLPSPSPRQFIPRSED